MGTFVAGYGQQLVLLVVVVVASLAAAASLRGSRPGPFGLNKPAAALAVGSGLAIAVATLTRRADAYRAGYVQLEPFATIRMYVWNGETSVVLYVLGNIALFVPLGFFTYLAFRRSILLTTLLTGLTSLAVEILQLPIWSRSTDVDDLICNTAGGFAGAVLAAIGWHAWRIVRQARARRQPVAAAAPPVAEASRRR